MAITPGDIRARFQAELNKQFDSLNESKSGDESSLINYLRLIFDKNGHDGKIESGRRPKHLRYMLGKSVNDSLDNINSILKKELNNYSIDAISPKDYKAGAYSGTYYTYIVKLEDAVTIKGIDYPMGLQFHIVNDDVPSGSFTSKILTPTGLGLPPTYLNKGQLVEFTKKAVRSKFSDQEVIVGLLTSMVDDVAGHSSKHNFESAGHVDSFEETIKYSPNTAGFVAKFDPSDLNTVGKDFGEILGAIYMMNACGYEKGVEFPTGNNPLVDFYIDGYGVSSKYKSGAAPTLTGIIKNVDSDQLTTQAQRELWQIFNTVESNKVSAGYLAISQLLNLPGYQKLVEITKEKNVTTESLNKFITDILAKDPDSFMQVFDGFYSTIGRYPQGKSVEWNKIKSTKLYGAIIGPMSYHVTDYLNSNGTYQASLTELLSKLEVKQLYLDFAPKKQEMMLHLKSFSTEGVKFTFEAPNQSVYSPDNGKLGFKMK
jgi:hypothetical protein